MNLELRSPDAFVRIVVALDKDVDGEVLNWRIFDLEGDDRHAASFGGVTVFDACKIKAHFQSPVVRENSTVEALTGRVAPMPSPGREALSTGVC